jgi:hypothetical protein
LPRWLLPWGVGYTTQDTLLKAIVAEVLPEGKRNFAFGLYCAGYGVGWLRRQHLSGTAVRTLADRADRILDRDSTRLGADLHFGEAQQRSH